MFQGFRIAKEGGSNATYQKDLYTSTVNQHGLFFLVFFRVSSPVFHPKRNKKKFFLSNLSIILTFI